MCSRNGWMFFQLAKNWTSHMNFPRKSRQRSAPNMATCVAHNISSSAEWRFSAIFCQPTLKTWKSTMFKTFCLVTKLLYYASLCLASHSKNLMWSRLLFETVNIYKKLWRIAAAAKRGAQDVICTDISRSSGPTGLGFWGGRLNRIELHFLKMSKGQHIEAN